ncbi:hypothetical protein EMCRGX_G005390 [Ephydatia muelleri]
MMARLGLCGNTLAIVADIYNTRPLASKLARTATHLISHSEGGHLASCPHGFRLGDQLSVNHLAYADDVLKTFRLSRGPNVFKYLGCPVGTGAVSMQNVSKIKDSFLRDTETIMTSALAEWQKLDAYRVFLFSRLTYAMKVFFPAPMWCRKLDTASLGDKFKKQPLPNTTGANRSDLTSIAPDGRSAILVDVCIPFEGSPEALQDAAQEKRRKYEPLCQTLLTCFERVEVFPFVIGSLGTSSIVGSQDIWYRSTRSLPGTNVPSHLQAPDLPPSSAVPLNPWSIRLVLQEVVQGSNSQSSLRLRGIKYLSLLC